jgi:hypothetical protein
VQRVDDTALRLAVQLGAYDKQAIVDAAECFAVHMSSSLLLIRIIPIYISIIATFYPVVKENICRDWETFSSLVLYLPLCYNKNREKKEDTPCIYLPARPPSWSSSPSTRP